MSQQQDPPTHQPQQTYTKHPSPINLPIQIPAPQPPKNNSPTTHNILSIPHQQALFPSSSTTTPHTNCPFIRHLSADIRVQIYSHLLLNPLLSSPKAISTETDFGRSKKYNLHPSILRVCKEIHEEASSVLYSLNIFYMVGMKSTRMDRFTLADFIGGSPLTRYWRDNAEIFSIAPEARLYLCKVRRWRVEVSWYGSPEQSTVELPIVSIRN
ncbi:hypothetical protein EAF04_007448 [Stromatinia cepivora]|nr:hypothetical protein EAF04_007448 [Stromatinia cepivora]